MCYHRREHEGGEDVEDALPEETDDAVDSNTKVEEVHKDGDHEDMVPSCRRPGMMCLVLPWTRRMSDGRDSRRSSTSKTTRFGGGSLDKKLCAEGTRT